MRRFIYLVIFSYISIIVSAQVNVESTINKTKIKIGEPIEWKIIAKSNNTAKAVSYTHPPSPRDRTRSRMPSSA